MEYDITLYVCAHKMHVLVDVQLDSPIEATELGNKLLLREEREIIQSIHKLSLLIFKLEQIFIQTE